MTGRAALHLGMGLLGTLILASECASLRELAGLSAQGESAVATRPTEPQWLLIKKPRFEDVPSEAAYVWAEESARSFTVVEIESLSAGRADPRKRPGDSPVARRPPS
jgi:hypothetical protein